MEKNRKTHSHRQSLTGSSDKMQWALYHNTVPHVIHFVLPVSFSHTHAPTNTYRYIHTHRVKASVGAHLSQQHFCIPSIFSEGRGRCKHMPGERKLPEMPLYCTCHCIQTKSKFIDKNTSWWKVSSAVPSLDTFDPHTKRWSRNTTVFKCESFFCRLIFFFLRNCFATETVSKEPLRPIGPHAEGVT